MLHDVPAARAADRGDSFQYRREDRHLGESQLGIAYGEESWWHSERERERALLLNKVKGKAQSSRVSTIMAECSALCQLQDFSGVKLYADSIKSTSDETTN